MKSKKQRESKNTDQAHVERAYLLLLNLIEQHEAEIEPTLWVGAMIVALADNYNNSGIEFAQFKKEIIECVEHYKY